LSTNASGGKVSDMRYYPYGETRSGTIATDRRYTGQRQEIGLGLYDYNARSYDPSLSRFIQADSMVPSPANPQSLNRYAYTLNNPLRYTDPSGHLTPDELRHLLGDSYDYLMELWRTYDPYWMAILEELRTGDRLEATLMQGQLHIINDNGIIRAFGANGATSADLKDWQGQGAYRIDRAGLTDEEEGRLADRIFNAHSSGNVLVEPRFQYNTNGEATYLGGVAVTQSLGKTVLKGCIEATVELVAPNVNADTFDWGVDIVMARMGLEIPLVGKLIVDIGISVIATYNQPKTYSVGWPLHPDPVNENYKLEWMSQGE